ncbi:MAG: AMP-binding protein, partial [Lachnospiraceae bacterium]|nr:AMP-binding protein [Lachnospiraceae bacterium]
MNARSLKDTVGVMLNGKTVVFADESKMNDPRALCELICTHGADAVSATPSRYREYLEYRPFAEALSDMKLIAAGGESLSQGLLKSLQSLGNARILNTYGPTEITVSSNMAELTKAALVTNGRPILNVLEYIVDKNGSPVPIGVKGELLIGGPGVAAGYRGLKEQTEERFITYRGERVYRTGDYARWTEDGQVVILGRMDDQIKLRGLRIELSEIQSVLEEQPDVKSAVVTVRKREEEDILAAYYTSKKEIEIHSLKAGMRRKLPHYMIPSAFVRMEAIPVNANGKADLKALPEPEPTLFNEELRQPETESEQRVFSILAETLKTESFGMDTSLEELGLSSLSRVGFILRLSEAFDGRAVSFDTLKEYDTPARLAAYLSKEEERQDFEVRDRYPLTRTQSGSYVECLSHPGTTIYNIPTLFKLGREVDPDRLKKAVSDTLNAHSYLKARLLTEDGEVFLKRNDEEPPFVEYIRLEVMPQTEELVLPYELNGGRLYQARLYETPEECFLFLDLHHIIADGASRRILQRDIERAYAGGTLKKESFTGFEAALLEEEERKSKKYIKAREWYDSVFSGSEERLPPPAAEENTGEEAGTLPFTTKLSMGEVQKLCEQISITPNVFFNGVFAYTLACFSDSEEAVFTTIYNGRRDSRYRDTVAMLVKTLPVRVNTGGGQTVEECLILLRDQLAGSMEYDIYSFGEASRAYHIDAEAMFVWQDRALEQNNAYPQGSDLVDTVIRPISSAAKSALSVEAFVRNEEIT